jgi:hypothetical protein
VVWYGFDGTDDEIFLFDGITTTKLTCNCFAQYPQVNDNGYVVWQGWDGYDSEIFLYDGITTTQLTDNAYDDVNPQINNNGYVVWEGFDFIPDWPDWEIFLYDGMTTTQLTDNSYNDYNSQINNNGYVVWRGFDGTDFEIFLYNGMTTDQLTDNFYNDWYPQINNHGYVVWYGFDGTDNEIFVTSAFTPNGGEVIPSGGTYTIQWDAPIEAVNFKLKYSMDNSLTWTPIPKTDDFVQGTSYNWTVPTPLGNKKTCLVKVIGYNASGVWVGSDKSDEPFTIEVVRVDSPRKGDTLISSNPYPITWHSNNTKYPISRVKLSYTKDGGVNWIPIVTLTEAQYLTTGFHSYDFTPKTKTKKTQCRVKVELKDESGNVLGEDVSNGYFIIKP